ncbi:hypothetical protein AB0I81_30740 [Nonomuraea sp. NPDC050404]|uniref:WXG100-like domain-containing protein n=1 Tax=Nonomuraea sp. NPDC050404 TaxID=3155783 RepID=UPI003408C551
MTNTGGIEVQGPGGQASRQDIVRIDTDIRPVWETEALPGWVVHWLIPMLSAGQKWTNASESGVSKLAQAYVALGDATAGPTEPAGSAARTIVTGWQAPATGDFVVRARKLFGEEAGLAGVTKNARAYAQQASNFAVETQYTKLSINVAFWVTVIAIGIAIVVSFFSAGTSTALVGPYAAAARAAMSRLLARLAAVAGRQAGATGLARVTTLSGATGRGAINQLLASAAGRELMKELPEEIGEEFFIDWAAQKQQIDMGTRKEWDWQKSSAAIVGAGTGAVVGTRLAGPVSRVTGRVPGFAGRALTTGLTNTIASPAGSFIANGMVYGQWQNPFTADSLMGGFLGGAGRTGSISPFNPDVAAALIHPTSTLAAAYDAAAQTDASRAAGPGGPGGPASPQGSPTGPDGNGPVAPATARTPDPSTVPAPRTSATTSATAPASGPGQATRPGTALPDLDPSSPRRSTTSPETVSAPAPDEDRDQQPNTATHPTPAPQSTDAAPQSTAPTPQSTNGTPQDTGAAPQRADTTPQATAPTSQNADSAAQATTASPQSTDSTPQSTNGAPQDTSGAPQSANAAPQDTNAAPQGPDAATAPSEGDATGRPSQVAGDPAQTSAASPLTAESTTRTSDAPARTADGTTPTGVGPARTADGSTQAGATQTGSAPAQAADGPTAATGVSAQAGQGPARKGDTSSPASASASPASSSPAAASPASAAPDSPPPAARATPPVRARLALMDALGVNFPGAVVGPNGDLIVPTADGDRVITAATMTRIRAILDMRATELHNQADLEVEAASLLLVAVADDSLSSAIQTGPAQDTAAQNSPAQDTTPAPAHTSRPGTVTSRQIPGTRYVNDTRQGPDLTTDEAKAATADLRPDHFRNANEDVQDLTWSQDGRTLVVRTRTGGTQHFRPVIGGLDRNLMARTHLRAGTADDPHVVHLAPRMANDQLPRVWLHEITDTLQRLAAGDGTRRRGILRRMLPGGGRPARDDCVPARRNELAYLTEQWRRAATLPEQRRLAVDIDGVRRELIRHGDTPPPPPWAPAPDERRTNAPAVPGAQASADDVRSVIASLERAEQALKQRVKAKEASAKKAGEQEAESRRTARSTVSRRDSGAAERARKAEKEADGHRDTRERHTEVAKAYAAALAEATEARRAYERLLSAIEQSATPARPGQVSMADIARSLTPAATAAHERFLDALRRALPQDIALSAAMPAGRLAHIGALTSAVNDLLARNGANARFTTDGLERALRADFPKAVSDDGVVLSVGEGRSAAEVRIKLTLSDLVEILDPAIGASEMMTGFFTQADRTTTATEAHTAGAPVGFDTRVLTRMAPDTAWLHVMGELVGVGVGVSAGRNWSDSGGGGTYAQVGAVSDNRGESVRFDAAATWTAEIRTGRDQQWRGATTVNSGAPGDVSSQGLWVGHSHLAQPPRWHTVIDEGKRDPEMPTHVLTGMTGLEEALDALAARLGGEFTQIGSNGHRHLRRFVTQELPIDLRAAANGGLERVLAARGEPDVTIRVKSEVVRVMAEPVGAPSDAKWREEVLVDFAASPGGTSSGGSVEVNASAGVNHPALQDVDVFGDLGDYAPNLAPRVKGSRSASQSYSSTANGQAIDVSVHRATDPEQSYRLVVRHTFTVSRPGERPVTLPTFESTALVSMAERAAYRFGLPVDENALLGFDGDGNPVMRGDVRPEEIKGRKPELPEWLGDGPGQMRGAGPALVKQITGLDGVTDEVLGRLAKLGVVPEIVDGVPQYDDNKLVRASQLLNEQEIVTQLSERRQRAGYDQLALDEGIHVNLVLHGRNSASENYTVRIAIQQHFGNRGTYIGRTDWEALAKLDIGTDTSARAITRTRTYAGNPSGSESEGPGAGQDGLSHETGLNAGANQARTAGSNTGSTVNIVTLSESTGPLALFRVDHTLTVDLLRDGKTTSLLDQPRSGSAILAMAAEFLPSTGPSHQGSVGRPGKSLLSRATLLHLDVPGVMDAARRVLPGAMRPDSPAFHHFAAFLNPRNLLSHPELLSAPITTDVAVRPQGVAATRAGLSVTGEMSQASVVSVIDHVTGRIIFGLGSAGVSWGGSSGHSIGASFGAGNVDDGGDASDTGDSSDSGKLSLPSRSGGSSTTTSHLDIWGTEELTIETGRQYLLRGDLDLTLTGTQQLAGALPLPSGGPESVRGAALFSIPEYDALRLYADGELSLPLPLVADAVERFRNGDLTLDRSLAVPLTQTYVKALTKAKKQGEETGVGAQHNPKALLKALNKVADLGVATDQARGKNPLRRLNAVLSSAAKLIERARNVVVSPQHENTMGLSVVESFGLTDAKGENVALLDAVMKAVNDKVPGAEKNTPTLRREMSVDFADDRGNIHLTDMWSPRGFEKSYHVHDGARSEQAGVLTVRARLVPHEGADPRAGEFLGHIKHAGIIIQFYRYGEDGHVVAYVGSYSAGADHSGTEGQDGEGAGVSTDRSRNYSAGTNEQGTRLQRIAMFNGLDRVAQQMRLVIEVEHRPARTRDLPGPVARPVTAVRNVAARPASAIRAAAARVRGGSRTIPGSHGYDVRLVRRMPPGMIRPAGEDPGYVASVPDPRTAELHPGFFPASLRQEPGRPSLLDVVTGQLSKMLGSNTIRERQAELVARLSRSALLAGFERMSQPDGDVVRVSRQKFKDQGADVTIKARLSDVTVVAGPFDAEKGQVDRKADAQNVSVSRGRVLPLGVSVNQKDATTGVDIGVKAGEQTSESVNDHHSVRRERSVFESGKAYIVRLRVDYDLSFQYMARRRDGDEKPVGAPVNMPGASAGSVDVVMFGEEIEELRSRMDSGVRLAPSPENLPTFRHVPPTGHEGLIETLREARMAARERGEIALVTIREADGVHRYRAHPDGTLRSESPDGGFAEAFATLPPALLDAAEQQNLPLRDIHLNSLTPGTFADQVTAELVARNALPAAPPAPVWGATAETPQQSSPAGGNFSTGVTPPSATSPEISGTPFDAAARADGTPGLTIEEVRGQDVSPADFGGAVADVRWTAGDRLLIQLPAAPDQHVRVMVADPGDGLTGRSELRSGTPEDPHVVRIGPRVDPLVVSSVLVHEISHLTQEGAAARAGAPGQGVVRASLSPDQAEGTDHCLLPRMDEHAHLTRKWHAATDPQARERLAEAIDAIAADLERRGHTPPRAPWEATDLRRSHPNSEAGRGLDRLHALLGALSEASAPRQRNSLASVLNGEPATAGPLASALGGGRNSVRSLTAELRAEAGKAGLAPGQPGAAARTAELVRAGELTPGQVEALRGPAPLPETAAARAVERAAALMGGRGRPIGPGLVGIEIPGHPPITVEIRPPGSGPAAQESGVVTYQMDGHGTVGANERAAAATAAGAVARALGLPVGDHRTLAELHEAVRQVRAATPAQRPARLGVLHDLAIAAPGRLIPAPLAADLATLLAGPRPGARHAYWKRMRTLSDGTGWLPPEEECPCPADLPCVCGGRADPVPGPRQAPDTVAGTRQGEVRA